MSLPPGTELVRLRLPASYHFLHRLSETVAWLYPNAVTDCVIEKRNGVTRRWIVFRTP